MCQCYMEGCTLLCCVTRRGKATEADAERLASACSGMWPMGQRSLLLGLLDVLEAADQLQLEPSHQATSAPMSAAMARMPPGACSSGLELWADMCCSAAHALSWVSQALRSAGRKDIGTYRALRPAVMMKASGAECLGSHEGGQHNCGTCVCVCVCAPTLHWHARCTTGCAAALATWHAVP